MRRLKLKKKNKSIVPPSIELLFDNKRLEIVKTMCLLYAFYLKNNKKFNKVSDIVFYYSLVNFDLINLFEENNKSRHLSTNLYFRFQTKINQILLELSNLKYIDIKGDLSYKTDDIGVRLTIKGAEFLKGIEEVEFISKLVNEYTSVLSKIESTSINKNKLKGGI
jgi:hypothetical protein